MLVRVLNSGRGQSVACCTVKVGARSFYFNVPENFQRFTKENGIRLEAHGCFVITRPELSHLLSLPGTMFSMVEKDVWEGVRVVLPLSLMPFVNANSYYFGWKFNAFAFLGVGARPGEIVAQPGRSRGCELLTDAQGNAEFLERAAQLDPATRARLNLPERDLSTKSRFFAAELLQSRGVLCLREGEHEIFLFRLGKTQPSLNALFVRDNSHGKFDPARLAEFGIKNEDMRVLTLKGSVVKDGVEIRAEQLKVRQKSFGLLVLDLRAEQWKEFSQCEFLKALFAHEEIELRLAAHLCPATEATQLVSCGLLNAFDAATRQLFLHPDFDDRLSTHPQQSRYGLLNASLAAALPFFFPREPVARSAAPAPAPDALLFRSFCEVRVGAGPVVMAEYAGREGDLFKGQNAAAKVQRLAESVPQLPPFRDENPLLRLLRGATEPFSPFFVTLGTGSMVPHIGRNVSATLLGFSPDCFCLLDCGEGTLFQLEEQFGALVEEVLRRLRVVLVSHVHGDHSLGLYGLLLRRRQLKGAEPLFVVAPANVMPMLRAYLDEGKDATLRAISTAQLHPLCEADNALGSYSTPWAETALADWFHAQKATSFNELGVLCQQKGVESILPVPVNHCPGSVGYVLDYSGYRTVYSGDCRPSELLAQFGRGADLLLHECTFDCSEDPRVVDQKGHCSVQDALTVAQAMKARFICLTHFSQRTQLFTSDVEEFALPAAEDKTELFFRQAFMAVDHLYFDFARLPQMPGLSRLLHAEMAFPRARGGLPRA